jgi:hypothetical protein
MAGDRVFIFSFGIDALLMVEGEKPGGHINSGCVLFHGISSSLGSKQLTATVIANTYTICTRLWNIFVIVCRYTIEA